MEINDLILKELLKRGYSLEGNTRVWNVADSKLWYLIPEQAQAYLDLEYSPVYSGTLNQAEGDRLLTENALFILKKLSEGNINVVDLGCGDGKKAAILISAFNNTVKIRYCPIDISGYMVSKAIETFSSLNLGEIVEFQYNISDFENLENLTPLLTKGKFKRNLFLLLNTIGNFEITDLLYEINGAMRKNDLLVVSTIIADSSIPERTELHSKNKKFDDFLSYIPMQLGLGKEEIQYSVRFKNHRFEFYYTIKKDKQIKFQDKAVYFNEGDQIIVAVVYKHSLKDLKKYFNMFFKDVEIIFSKNSSQVLVLCRK